MVFQYQNINSFFLNCQFVSIILLTILSTMLMALSSRLRIIASVSHFYDIYFRLYSLRHQVYSCSQLGERKNKTETKSGTEKNISLPNG